MTGLVPVTAAPVFDPDAARADLRLPAGLTIAEIVACALPGYPKSHWAELRVVLITPEGVAPIAPELWHRVRPKPGVHTVIRARPGWGALANVLMSVLSSAASSLGSSIAAAIVPTAGALQTGLAGLITVGLTVAGALLVQALIPQPTADGERRATYAISGWRNEFRPEQPVPLVLGKHRFAPFFAAGSYTEIEGDMQYVRALFTFGYGRVDISDIRIGDTPIDEYDEVEMELREGLASDDPVTLYPRQVIEDPANVELVRPMPRDDAGELINGGTSVETPVVRFTAADASQAVVLLSFSGGLFEVNDNGKMKSRTVEVRIEQRAEGATTWLPVTTFSITAKKREAFFRHYGWVLPSRGRWEIRVTRMTDESTDNEISDRSFLAALQSIRPEYPLNFPKPLSLLALRVKATHQLTGALDNVNAVVHRYGPVWDGEVWSEGLTRNPASAYLSMLQSEANPFPVADSGIDLGQIADWYEFCETKGLKYDRIHAAAETLFEGLALVCAAGRAAPRHDGARWGVVIDRPDTLVIDHVNPRNASGMRWSRTYFDPPDGFRVAFHDETNNYERAERVVPWPGHAGEVVLTEALVLAGKTDPDEIFTETRRRMYELIHRPDTFSAVQDGQARVATRGDKVMGSFDILSRSQLAARVVSVAGAMVELDQEVTMAAGTDYGLRFRHRPGDEVIGTSELRQVVTEAGTRRAVRLVSGDLMPEPDTLVHFGELATESLELRVKAVEPGENASSVLHMVAAAPVIDQLVDAGTPPAWNGRVGAEIELDAVAPGVPYFTGIEHGILGTGDHDGLRVLFLPGGGTVPTANIRIEHRLVGAPSYTTLTVPAASGATDLSGYSAGDEVEIRLVGLAADGTESAASTPVTVEIGASDPAEPGALDESSIVVEGGLGYASLAFHSGSDPDLARVQIYRVPSGGTLNTDTHAVGSPIPVVSGTTFTFVDGDGTRANQVADGGMNNPTSWTAGANWSVATGTATHSAGAADDIRQSGTFADGETYRGRVEVSGRTAGDLTPTLFGGTAQTATAISADGTEYFAITATSGNNALGFDASSDFDGTIDNVVLFLVTAGCTDQGDYDYYLEPQNSIGGAGPVSSAFPATIT